MESVSQVKIKAAERDKANDIPSDWVGEPSTSSYLPGGFYRCRLAGL
jgi:hypothetical protein